MGNASYQGKPISQKHILLPKQTQINNSFKNGVLRLYDDDATERGIMSHPTAIQFAYVDPSIQLDLQLHWH